MQANISLQESSEDEEEEEEEEEVWLEVNFLMLQLQTWDWRQEEEEEEEEDEDEELQWPAVLRINESFLQSNLIWATVTLLQKRVGARRNPLKKLRKKLGCTVA